MFKRLIDVALAMAILLVCFPFFVLLLLLQRLHFRSPFFVQQRIGLNDTPFFIYKLKTMRDGSEPEEIRVTSWGLFLRSTHLDEIPQLWLIIRGTMSIVGPRPLLPEYLAEYSDYQRLRHKVKPGILGLAQSKGANSLSWEQQFDLDVQYATQASLLLDLKILFCSPLLFFRKTPVIGRKPFKRS